jgi:hypothetical protein
VCAIGGVVLCAVPLISMMDRRMRERISGGKKPSSCPLMKHYWSMYRLHLFVAAVQNGDTQLQRLVAFMLRRR